MYYLAAYGHQNKTAAAPPIPLLYDGRINTTEPPQLLPKDFGFHLPSQASVMDNDWCGHWP